MDQSTICYQTAGFGLPLVFIHGAGCDHRVWMHQSQVFLKDHQVLLIDLPGHGNSDKPRISYTMPYLAEAVAAVLHEEQITNAVLVGQSMGALVCRVFSETYADQVRGIVSVDGSFHQVRYSVAAHLAMQLMRTPVYRPIWEAFVTSSVAEAPESLVELINHTAMDAPPHVVQSIVYELYRAAKKPPGKVTKPLLVINSRSGNFNNPQTWASFRSIAPHAEIEIVDAGHMLMFEQPEIFNNHLLAFLSRLGNNVRR